MRLLCFNPENDLALAANDPHYTPPASARQMAQDLASLPQMWAEESDTLTLQGESPIDCILPWGWSPLLVQRLRNAGVAESLLPTVEQMAAYRAFASRETAVRLLAALKKRPLFSSSALDSTWCTTEDEVLQACSNYGASVLKMPWSGSGRGLRPVDGNKITEKDFAWIRRTLKRQGGVEVEPKYDKIQDFAMEFWAENGQVRYEGLSVFETTAGGVYAGNLVATEKAKEARLAHYISPSRLLELQKELTALLSTAGIPEWYEGPLGVDMMVVSPHPSARAHSLDTSRTLPPHPSALHPLVEINLRMTMGWVALKLQRKLSPGEQGTFCIRQTNGQYHAVFIKKGV